MTTATRMAKALLLPALALASSSVSITIVATQGASPYLGGAPLKERTNVHAIDWVLREQEESLYGLSSKDM
jgi:hypothetical protein